MVRWRRHLAPATTDEYLAEVCALGICCIMVSRIIVSHDHEAALVDCRARRAELRCRSQHALFSADARHHGRDIRKRERSQDMHVRLTGAPGRAWENLSGAGLPTAELDNSIHCVLLFFDRTHGRISNSTAVRLLRTTVLRRCHRFFLRPTTCTKRQEGAPTRSHFGEWMKMCLKSILSSSSSWPSSARASFLTSSSYFPGRPCWGLRAHTSCSP